NYDLKPALILRNIFCEMCTTFSYCVVVLRTLCLKGKLIFKFIPVSESFKPMFRKIAQNLLASLVVLLFCNFSAFAQPDGKALFNSNCASCHHPIKESTGPALQGTDQHPHGKEWV